MWNSLKAGTADATLVYWGQTDEGDPIVWYAIESDPLYSGMLTLLSVDLVPNGSQTTSPFRTVPDPWPSTYEGSDLQAAMEARLAEFSDAEKAAMVGRELMFAQGSPTPTDQKLWPLSWEIAGGLPQNLLGLPGVTTLGPLWWLVDGGNDTEGGAVWNVDDAGVIKVDRAFSLLTDQVGVRPSTSINMASVLFTSPAAGGKNVAQEGVLEATEALPGTTPEVKLTVIDQAMDLDLLSHWGTNDDLALDQPIMVFDENAAASTAAGLHLSAALRTGPDTDYYGRLAPVTQDGNDTGWRSLQLPATLGDGTYSLDIFSEQVRADGFTDFASEPVTVTLVVNGGVATVDSYTGNLSVNRPYVAVERVSHSLANPTAPTVEVTFTQSMDTSRTPSLSLSSWRDATPVALAAGTWSANQRTYSAPFPGIAYETQYQVAFDPADFANVGGIAPNYAGPYTFVSTDAPDYRLTATTAPNTTLTGLPARAAEGAEVVFSVTVPAGKAPHLTGAFHRHDKDGNVVSGSVPINGANGIYRFTMPKGDLEIDLTAADDPARVTGLGYSFTGAAGKAFTVNFSQTMNTSLRPALVASSWRSATPVQLAAGSWSADRQTYSAPYPSLAYETRYTVEFDPADFADTEGSEPVYQGPYTVQTGDAPDYGLSHTASAGVQVSNLPTRAAPGDQVTFTVTVPAGQVPRITSATYARYGPTGQLFSGNVSVTGSRGQYRFTMPRGDVALDVTSALATAPYVEEVQHFIESQAVPWVSLTFSEPMDTTLTPTLRLSNWRVTQPTELPAGSWSQDGRTYQVYYGAMNFETEYTLAFDPADFADLEGAPAEYSGPYTFVSADADVYPLRWGIDAGLDLGAHPWTAAEGDLVEFAFDNQHADREVSATVTFSRYNKDGQKIEGTAAVAIANGAGSFTMPKGTVNVYVTLGPSTTPSWTIYPVRPAHVGVRLDVNEAKIGESFTATFTKDPGYYISGVTISVFHRDWAEAREFQSYAINGGSSWTYQLPAALELEGGDILYVDWEERRVPYHRLQYSYNVEIGDGWGSAQLYRVAPPEGSTKTWHQPGVHDPGTGYWYPGDLVYSDGFANGEQVNLTFKAFPVDTLFEVEAVTLGDSEIPFTFTPDRSDGAWSRGTVSFTMPEFTTPAEWDNGQVVISFKGEHWPQKMKPQRTYTNSRVWDEATKLEIVGDYLVQVKGGGEFSSFTPAEQAILRTVTLKNEYSGIEVSVPDDLIRSDGAQITLSPELKASLGAVPQDSTFVLTLTMGGTALTTNVNTTWSVRAAPYGLLGVVALEDSDGTNLGYRIIPADTQAQLEGRAAGQKVVLVLAGEVKWNTSAGGYVFSEGSVLVNNLFTYVLSEGNTLTVREPLFSGSVTLTGIGGKASFPGAVTGNFGTLEAGFARGTTYSMTEYADPDLDPAPAFENVTFRWERSGNWTLPVGQGLNAVTNSFKLLQDRCLFSGRLRLGVFGLAEDIIDVNIERLQYRLVDGEFRKDGVEAYGQFSLIGDDQTGFLSYVDIFDGNYYYAKVNTFPEERQYKFDLEGNYGIIEGAILLDLVESKATGGLVPNDIGMKGYGETGVDIIPPRLVTFKGGGFYLYNLAKSIDLAKEKLILPAYIEVLGRVGVVELITLDGTIRMGPGRLGWSQEQSVGIGFLSLPFAAKSFDLEWAGMTNPNAETKMSARMSGTQSYTYGLATQESSFYAAIKKERYSSYYFDFGGTAKYTVQVPGFTIPVVNWDLGPWFLAQLSAAVARDQLWVKYEVLDGAGWIKAGLKYSPAELYADAGWRFWIPLFGEVAGTKNLFTVNGSGISILSVGQELSTAGVLEDSDGNEAGTVSIGDGWRLVGSYGMEGARAAVSPLGSNTAPASVLQASTPQTSYELAPITGEDGYGNMVGLTGLTGDNLEVLYKDRYGAWQPYPLIWESQAGGTGVTVNGAANPLANAVDFSGGTFEDPATGEERPGTVLIKLDPELSANWKVAAKDQTTTFTSSQVQTDPLAGLDAAVYDESSQTLTVTPEHLTDLDTGVFDPDKYFIEVKLVSKDGLAAATLATDVAVDATGPVAVDLASALAALPVDLPSGDYQLEVALQEDTGEVDETGAKVLEGMDFLTAVSAGPQGAGSAPHTYRWVNPNIPAALTALSVTPSGDGAFELTWDAVRPASADTDTDYIDYEVRALTAAGEQVLSQSPGGEAITAEDGQAWDIDQAPHQTLAWTVSHEDVQADGSFRLPVGNLPPGASYKFEVTPVRTIIGSDGAGSYVSGPAFTSAPVALPVPAPAGIELAFDGANASADAETGETSVYARAGYTLNATFDQDVTYTVRDGDTVLATGPAQAGQAVQVQIPGDAQTPARLITVGAVNGAGDSSYSEYTSYFTDVAPALYLEADANGFVYADESGAYTLLGRTSAGHSVAIEAGDGTQLVTAGADGLFRYDGNMADLPSAGPGAAATAAGASGDPATAEARWLSATVFDTVGNTSTETVKVVVGQWPVITPTVAVALAEVRRGAEQTASGAAWEPGESVSITVADPSAPLTLGPVTADEAGNISPVTFTVPQGFALGAHTVTFTGEFSGAATASFTVVSAGGQDPAGGDKATLPVTGADVWPPTLWAAFLVLTGAALLAARRRHLRLRYRT
ncbi:MAG: hypothetical protein LBS27_12165 [Bifidobacteriaceae bacterium]|nr:hypothetical protein [Bifidobacteriaceae bacterium]